MKNKWFGGVILALLICGLVGFARSGVMATQPSKVIYVAHLHAMNSNVAGHEASGLARFVIQGGKLTISVHAAGLAPDIMHMQHIHGFVDGRAARCATAAADVNGDGVVDLAETEPFSGTTMVPFNGDPVSMNVAAATYPKASRQGSYEYRKTVSLTALEMAFTKAFPGQKLDLARRVFYIHGVAPDTRLPTSAAASLGTVPAQVTLPVACGKITEIKPARR